MTVAPGEPGQEPAAPADLVAAAALAVPGVSRLHAGSFGEVATYLPGRRVTGVRVSPDLTEVHLVVQMDAPVLETAALVREAVAPIVATAVDVFVEDLDQTATTSPSTPTPVRNTP